MQCKKTKTMPWTGVFVLHRKEGSSQAVQPHSCIKCRFKCGENIPEEQRQQIFLIHITALVLMKDKGTTFEIWFVL